MNGMLKIRCIDDFTASLVNSAVVHSERTSPDTLDTLVALVRHIAIGGQRVAIRWRKDGCGWQQVANGDVAAADAASLQAKIDQAMSMQETE